MAKKNCRMTDEERAVHDRAVSLRKMTDQQLCEFMDRQHSLGVDEGIRLAKEDNAQHKGEADTVERFINYLAGKVGSGNGIGGGAILRLRKEAQNAITDGVIGGTA
jgi:hypothetical protein